MNYVERAAEKMRGAVCYAVLDRSKAIKIAQEIIADVKRGCMKAVGKEMAGIAYAHNWFDLDSLLEIIKEAEPTEE